MSLHINGRRWFNGRFGNTYHTTQVFENGELVFSSEPDSGYGEAYLQTAFNWLAHNGHPELLEKDGSVCSVGTRFLREEMGGTYTVSDVLRESDL